jgi:hypothetical protein
MTRKSARPRDVANLPVEQRAANERAPVFDFERLTPEVGWMLIGVGVLGVILPGLPGAPFFLVGGAALVPGGRRRMARWIRKHPGPITRQSMRILTRFMDDLEAEYPHPRRTARPVVRSR